MAKATSRDEEAEQQKIAGHQELKRAFEKIDTAGSGAIDASEIKALMEELGESVTAEQAQRMLEEADTDGGGDISYDEFVAALTMQSSPKAGVAQGNGRGRSTGSSSPSKPLIAAAPLKTSTNSNKDGGRVFSFIS